MITLATRALLYAALSVFLLAGCGYQYGPFDEPNGAGGVATTVGEVHVDDIYAAGPHGIPAHASAPLHFVLTNDSDRTDALVGISTPLAADVKLGGKGRPVSAINIPAGAQKNFEWRAGAVLEDIDRPVAAGHWFPVTFRFAHAGTVTLHVTAGPLGSPATTQEGKR